MKKYEKLRITGLLLSFLYIALAYTLDGFSFLNLDYTLWKRVGIPISIFIYFGLSFWEILKLRNDNNNYRDTLPILFLKKCGIEDKYLSGVQNAALFAEFVNNPKHLTGSNTAEKVHATIKWINSSGKLYSLNQGRWWYPYPQTYKPLELQTVDIEPNNETKKLHLAIKRPDCEWCEIWDRTEDGHEVFPPLPEDQYKVEINLKGRNVDQDFTLIVDVSKSSFSIHQ